jgi:hypothetical protein
MSIAEMLLANRRRGKPMKALSDATEKQRRRRQRQQRRGGGGQSAGGSRSGAGSGRPKGGGSGGPTTEQEEEQLSRLAQASRGGPKPSLAPQLAFDPVTGRIIIDEVSA